MIRDEIFIVITTNHPYVFCSSTKSDGLLNSLLVGSKLLELVFFLLKY